MAKKAKNSDFNPSQRSAAQAAGQSALTTAAAGGTLPRQARLDQPRPPVSAEHLAVPYQSPPHSPEFHWITDNLLSHLQAIESGAAHGNSIAGHGSSAAGTSLATAQGHKIYDRSPVAQPGPSDLNSLAGGHPAGVGGIRSSSGSGSANVPFVGSYSFQQGPSTSSASTTGQRVPGLSSVPYDQARYPPHLQFHPGRG